MSFSICISKPAGDIRAFQRLTHKGKTVACRIAILTFHSTEIYAVFVHPGRGTCFKAGKLKAKAFQTCGKRYGRRQTRGTGRKIAITHNHPSVQISTGGKNNGRCQITCTCTSFNTCYFTVFSQNPANFRLFQKNIGLSIQILTHGLLILAFIYLSAQCSYSRAFTGIQKTNLYLGLICNCGHGAAKGIYFPNNYSFSSAANGRVTGGKGNIIHAHGNKRNLTAKTRCGQGSFTACMTGSHHNNIIVACHKRIHTSFF